MKQITAGINQRYVVRITERTIHEIEVNAASAQEAETLAWREFWKSPFDDARQARVRVTVEPRDVVAKLVRT